MAEHPPLVSIEWLDSGQPIPNWQWLDGFERRRPHKCISVGFLIQDDEQTIVVAPNLGASNGDDEWDQAAGDNFLFEPFGRSRACVSADAAGVLICLGVAWVGRLSTLAAMLAARAPVFSFLAIAVSLIKCSPLSEQITRKYTVYAKGREAVKLSRVAELDQRTTLRIMSASGGCGRRAPKEVLGFAE